MALKALVLLHVYAGCFFISFHNAQRVNQESSQYECSRCDYTHLFHEKENFPLPWSGTDAVWQILLPVKKESGVNCKQQFET